MDTATAELDTCDGGHNHETPSMASSQSNPGIDDASFASPSAGSIVYDGDFGRIILLGCAVQTFVF